MAESTASEAAPKKKTGWADYEENDQSLPSLGTASPAAADAAADVATTGDKKAQDSSPATTGKEDDLTKDLNLGNVSIKEEGEEAVEGTVDKPEVAIKSGTLNEEVEAPETEIRKVMAGDDDTPYVSAKRFEDLALSEPLLKGLYNSMKFEKPSKIQAETLPMILSPPHRNLIAQAHNGSGKTTCFVLGMLSRVDPNVHEPQAICVCPTRELAIQNEEVSVKMGCYTGITVACTAVAEAGHPAITRRDRIVDQVVIGTPGTLKKWMTKDRILRTDNIRILVFDEADHMLDQDGFQDDSLRIMRDIKRATNNKCQVLLFSATFSDRVREFAHNQVRPANEVFVPREELSLDVIRQYCVKVPTRDAKTAVLKDHIFPIAEKLGQSIIFVRTRETARELHRRLEADGHRCTSIQGAMSHEDRDRVIREFRLGTTKILIATDVLARGFDQAQVTLVVNYDIPVKANNPNEPEHETYLHRIGRSGRFGRKGAAFNLVHGPRDEMLLHKISKHFDREIVEVPWDDDDAFETVLKQAGLA
eukprot:jgi/Mesen1/2778/ME000170S01889